MNEHANISTPVARHVSWMIVGCLACIGMVWWGYGKLAAERVLTQLALPGGLLTLAMGYSLFLAVRQGASRWLQVVLAVCFLVYAFVGGGHANAYLYRRLQQDFLHVEPLSVQPAYDALIVLGGGLLIGADGRVNLGESGDRVVLAARMVHAGKAQRVFVTGCQRTGTPVSEPAAAMQLLTELGVDPRLIDQIPGANTIAELRAAKIALANAEYKRIGVVTSAWHLPRALRLAKSCELDVEPVPADFRSMTPKSQPSDWVPNGSGFADFGLAAKEFLAPLVGR